MFKRLVTYSTDKSVPANLVTIPASRAFEVIALNKAGEKPLTLSGEGEESTSQHSQYNDILGQDAINRFDRKKKKRKPKGEASAAPASREKQQGARQPKQPRPDDGGEKPEKAERAEKPEKQQRRPEGGKRGGRRGPRPGKSGDAPAPKPQNPTATKES